MKLNRRKLFAAGAGAAVAAKQMGGAAFDSHGLQTAAGPSPYYGSGIKDTPQADHEWTARQVARAKKLAAGDFSDLDRKETAAPPCPYQALRSVSDAARWWMRVELEQRRWRENMIQRGREALAHYDKFGVINHLL